MAEAIKAADVVLVSVRRRLPPKEDLDALRQHLAAGKPIVGIRTACHAWCLRTEKDNQTAAAAGHGVWPEFDPEVLGGHYVGHHGADVKTAITIAEAGKGHAILRGVDLQKFVGNGSLYRVNPLVESTTPLLIGTIPDKQPEPVAWANLAGPKESRVFNTTLGHIDDFQEPAFCKLLTNAIFWALDEPYPIGQDVEKLLPPAVK
jgi:type 1 glutamine amidotransferase